MNDAHWYNPPNLTEDGVFEEPFIHASAFVDTPCQIGLGTHIMHFSHVMANSVIGYHCQIGHNVIVSSGVMIGDNVHVLNNTVLSSGVILEDDVYCGPSTVFTPLKYVRANADPISTIQPTLVKQGSSIGANTTIAGGFTIGHHCFIESGSVVDRAIPNYALARGNPITIIGWRCECGSTLSFSRSRTCPKAECPECGLQYEQCDEFTVIKLAKAS